MPTNVIFVVALILLLLNFTPNYADSDQAAKNLHVSKASSEEVQIFWLLHNLQISTLPTGGYTFSKISFDNCKYPLSPGKPAIPYLEFVLGIPQDADIKVSISDIQYEYKHDILPLPIPAIKRDQKGRSDYLYQMDQSLYEAGPGEIFYVSEQQFFRSMPIVHVKFYPLSYNHASRSLKIIHSAKIRIRFEGGQKQGRRFFTNSKLDYLYEKLILNFDQAKNWLAAKPRTMAKLAVDFEGPWYGIEINADGLYKITPATLSSAGIDVSTIDPRTFKIYNHGGKPLIINTTASDSDPLEPVENAIFVSGEEDGSFDQQDYIIFYGTQLGGWNYSTASKDFEYIQHPYDTNNYYWLSFGSGFGKRMERSTTPISGATSTETFFMQRVHFEEDKYNLLASGADWYGHRFFGTAGNTSITLPLNYSGELDGMATMTIRFKSANGVKYDTPANYRYWFSVYLNSDFNSTPLILNATMGSIVGRSFSRTFNAKDYILDGDNTISISYKGDREECSAHLDWIQLHYPRDFQAINNYIMFYTNSLGQIVRYTITNLSSSDIRIFDISNPKEVKLLESGSAIQNGTFSFNLDLNDNQHKRIIASSLNSPEIKEIESLRSFSPAINLLNPSLSADLIVITHPSFESYAREIIAMREDNPDPLRGIAVNTRDIYFYFNSGVQDPVAIRNFIRYAFYHWSSPEPAYVLLFGDGHYDYRNIALPDTNRVPPYEISSDYEINSRETDNFYVDVNLNSDSFNFITPDLAIGRLPMESHLDARRMIDKFKAYEENKEHDGWQTVLTFVADDNVTSKSEAEWMHQRDTETLAQLVELRKFLKQKIYLSAFPSVPGGFGRVKPAANQAIIDQVNEGTLVINYMGHGSPQEWAHESVLNMTRDLPRIQNQGKLAFWIASTCDFGKYDDPLDPSFSEALLWIENRGAIGVLSSARLAYAGDNFRFNRSFLKNLFPGGGASARLGDALLLATNSEENDQKYHLFADPSMYLADPRGNVVITSFEPDTLKALSKVKVNGYVTSPESKNLNTGFAGGAFLIVNDARYDSVNTGGSHYYDLLGPRIFKGEITVDQGLLTGEFIVPKSIRYHNEPTGRMTLYAWNESGYEDALGYVDTLLFNGTRANLTDDNGPEIVVYFEDQEDFQDGDMVYQNPLLLAEIYDESGINLTQEVGHAIEIRVDEQPGKDVTAFFAYERDSYSKGKLRYHLEDLKAGEHSLDLQAWDNLNNPSDETINFRIAGSAGLVLSDVYNYPNPFDNETNFTFQAQGFTGGSEVNIKIYTVSGRLIKILDGLPEPRPGFNYYYWDGRDDDGDPLANGVYLYKIILKSGEEQKEVIEKLVVLR